MVRRTGTVPIVFDLREIVLVGLDRGAAMVRGHRQLDTWHRGSAEPGTTRPTKQIGHREHAYSPFPLTCQDSNRRAG